jgi:hypothetical protein
MRQIQQGQGGRTKTPRPEECGERELAHADRRFQTEHLDWLRLDAGLYFRRHGLHGHLAIQERLDLRAKGGALKRVALEEIPSARNGEIEVPLPESLDFCGLVPGCPLARLLIWRLPWTEYGLPVGLPNRLGGKARHIMPVQTQERLGLAPTNLAQLVPIYLQRVPADPFTGRPMVYRPEGPKWLLYSVGEDGVDNDGDPVAPSVAGAVTKGDIFYNSPY